SGRGSPRDTAGRTRSREVLPRLLDALDEPVDLPGEAVEVEARAVRGRDAELGHQRLAAVVAGADRDAVHVQHLRHVVRVDALEVEGDDPGAALRRRPVEADARDLRQPFDRLRGEL